MISGEVTAAREARIRLTLRAASGAEVEVSAIVDTGFTDAVTLSPALIAELDFPYRDTARALLADGRLVDLDVHKGVVLWDGERRTVYVHATDGDALVGMALLQGHTLTIEVMDGGPVTIE